MMTYQSTSGITCYGSTNTLLVFVAETNANPQPTVVPIYAPLIIDARTRSWLKSLKASA
jgi:hypothetical protein